MDGSMHNGGFQIDRNSWDLAPTLIWVSLSVGGGSGPQCRADAADVECMDHPHTRASEVELELDILTCDKTRGEFQRLS
jgi:hypothetical protein